MSEESKHPKSSDEAARERNEALAALKRARRRAEELAARTGTALIQAVDGKPVRVPPPAPPASPTRVDIFEDGREAAASADGKK
jgi:hypothetical protein